MTKFEIQILVHTFRIIKKNILTAVDNLWPNRNIKNRARSAGKNEIFYLSLAGASIHNPEMHPT